MGRFFLASLFLRSCFAVSLRRNAQADRESEACTDAPPGRWCHASVMWAKTVGCEQHPDWFPGDPSQYSLGDFQSLLHSLGEAECSLPCPHKSKGAGSRAVGLLELGESSSSTARLGNEVAPALDQTSTYGFSSAEFTEMMEESWEPKATTSTRGAAKTDEADCQDAHVGSMCYHAMTFLRTKGIAKHPTWYPSLNGDSTMRDVQEVLHTAGKADCPKPCPAHDAEQLKNFHDDDVIEVFDNGRQVPSAAYELRDAAADCGDTVEGEWCYNSIMWLKKTGLVKHPDWYPHLTRESSMADFQAALHNQRKMNCPLPCKNVSNVDASVVTESPSETNFEEVSQEDATTTVPEPIRTGAEQCEDALEGSHCYKAISRVIDVGIWMHPEQFQGLNRHSSRDQVQKHLYQHGKYECGWPCPKKQLDRSRRVLKRVEDMTEKELGSYMSHEWDGSDGYVDSDEYDPHEAVQPSDAEAALGAPAARSAGASSEQSASTADNATQPEEGVDAATLPGKDESTQEPMPVVNTKKQTPLGLKDQCRDAQVGELCYSAVTWAQGVGVHERPQWYTGLSKTSTFREFQAFLHKSRPGICEMPCGNLREVRPFEAEAEAADTSEELLPVIDGGGQKVVPTTTTEPTLEPEVQANSTAEANDTAEEPAMEADTSETSEEALPVVDPNGTEDNLPDIEQSVQQQQEATSTDEANATAEALAPQPGAATAEAAEGDASRAENATAAEELPALDQGEHENGSAVQEPAPQREANSTEEENRSAEEPAPQTEAATVEAAEADTSEEPLPSVDPEGQEIEIAAEEDMEGIEHQRAAAQEQASEPQSAEDAAMEAEQAAALQGARGAEANATEEATPAAEAPAEPQAEREASAAEEATSAAEAPAEPPAEAAAAEPDASEEPLPVVDPEGQELEIAAEDIAAIEQQRAFAKEQAELRAMVEALKAENAALKAQPAPGHEADQAAAAAPEPVPETNSTAGEEPALSPDAAAAVANTTAEEEKANTTAAGDTAAASDDNATSDSDDNATGDSSEAAAFAQKEAVQPRPRRKAVYAEPLPYVNQEARVTSVMQERDEEEDR
ncbi:unnamed protein product [Prorocentrum cordatum]|uniref:Thiol oxidase n=1 Tax=Prorocentrum cordatum TaxID=2364126 RepID=A0ABN9T186_9DINO|nr:unnamed protein product [Polarella glacialis]